MFEIAVDVDAITVNDSLANANVKNTWYFVSFCSNSNRTF